jgi:D-glycero-D-manno-heptose 1,7-bisphosphate phosphatase
MSKNSAASQFPGIQYVFLDRDGVINRKPPEGEYVGDWDHFHLLSGVEAAIAQLNHSGRRVLVVSNQRGIALGLYSISDVETIHQRLNRHLADHGAKIDAFYFCPHDKNMCDCRKPKTGLFEEAFRDFSGASASNSILIGDSISDIEAARNLKMPAIFIEGDPNFQKAGADKAAQLADAVSASLADAIRQYLV